MQRAVALSLEKMRANSGGPFGAVIVRNGTIGRCNTISGHKNIQHTVRYSELSLGELSGQYLPPFSWILPILP
jgi:hypothetical protein